MKDVIGVRKQIVKKLVLPCPTEAEEAKTLVAYLRVKGYSFWHTPNETGSSDEARRRAIRIKREGGAKGFPDYGIALPGIGIIFIELKRLKGSKTSPEQAAWIEILNQCPGVEAYVAYGAQNAIELIESITKSPSPPSRQVITPEVAYKLISTRDIF